ncbi:uncharacterized protein METZ01_LOCUS184783 [marine metagenome]|uniref:Uncharacterized protein n=1 Tax=marine metagenome TaxID=408172 RepID=A0A382D1E7_9ZZZZ
MTKCYCENINFTKIRMNRALPIRICYDHANLTD